MLGGHIDHEGGGGGCLSVIRFNSVGYGGRRAARYSAVEYRTGLYCIAKYQMAFVPDLS